MTRSSFAVPIHVNELAESADPSLRIILAEDNRQVRQLMAMALRYDGHEVAEVVNGPELIESLASILVPDGGRDYDVIISEQRLPGVLGLSVLTALRAANDLTPFVLMTTDPDVRAQATALGAVILDHPFDLQAIRGAVRRSGRMGEELATAEQERRGPQSSVHRR